MVEGVATATEVSTIGIAYTVVVGLLVYRAVRLAAARCRCWSTPPRCRGAILLIIGAATAMAWALTQSGFSRELAAAMTALPGGASTFLIVSIVAFVVLGSVLEGIPAIVLFGPLLFPIARAGRHPRGALRDGGDPRDGHRAVRAAVRRRLLRRLRHRPGQSGRGHAADLAYLLALLVGLLVVAAVPWISIGFL